jgi:tripartite-type tricarboxylate transporter receptor subunit TctC
MTSGEKAMPCLLRNLLGLALAIIAPLAAAQGYPAKPVKLIIPFSPGGSNDIVGRMAAAQLGERLGQPVIVDNRTGAGGTIGTEAAAKSPPDGYTVFLVSVAYAFNTSIYKKLPYDPVKSFVPVAMLGTGPAVLVVYPGLPANSLQELIALAKQKPGQLNYASAGVGSFLHLAAELFRLQAGVALTHVPYKGAGPATVDVMAGQAQLCVASIITVLPHIRSGRLRALGTTGSRRSPLLPDVPTFAEAGVQGSEATNWWGILAPAGTPQPVIERLHKELSTIIASAETKKRFDAEGAEALQMSAADFGRFIADETAKWARVVKEAGITAE